MTNILNDHRRYVGEFRSETRLDGAIDEGERPGRRGDARPVPIEDEAVRAQRVYVDGPCHLEAEQCLASRLLVLSSPAGTGKRTAALALLAAKAGPQNLVSLPPDKRLTSLANLASFTGQGLLYEGASEGELFRLQHHDLTDLLDKLRRDRAWLVVTVNSAGLRNDALQPHLVRWKMASVVEVLRSNIAHGDLGLDPDQRARIEASLDGKNFDGCSTMQVAEALEALRRVLPLDAGLDAFHRVLREAPRIELLEWLDGDPSLDDRCLAMVLGVMAGARTSDVVAADDALRTLLSADRTNRFRSTSFSSWSSALSSVHARTVYETVGRHRLSEEFVEFDLPSRRRTTLLTMFEAHPRLRTSVLEWIEQLGHSDSAYVRYQAALAAADLTERASGPVEQMVVNPWADSVDATANESAALWVDRLISERISESLAITKVRQWAGSGDPDRRWTAARALAGSMAVRYPETALNLIRDLIKENDTLSVIRPLGEFFRETEFRDSGRLCLERLVAWSSVPPADQMIPDRDRPRPPNADPQFRRRALLASLGLLDAYWSEAGEPGNGIVTAWLGATPLVEEQRNDARSVARLMCRGLVSPFSRLTRHLVEDLIRSAMKGRTAMPLARTLLIEMFTTFEEHGRLHDGGAVLRDHLLYLRDVKGLAVEPAVPVLNPVSEITRGAS